MTAAQGWLRSCAMVVALAGCAGVGPEQDPSTETAELGRRDDIHGIYILGNVELKNLAETDEEFIDGYALRFGWMNVDHGTTEGGPDYDFAIVDTAVATLEAIDKTMTMGIDVQLVPDYVLDNAEITYITTVPGPGHTEFEAETPVTWDANTLASYTDFMTALATHPVCRTGATCDDRDKVPLRDHPVLAGIRITILGMGKLRQTSNNTEGTIFEVPSYTRERFVDAVIDNLHAAQDQFPAIPTWVPYFSVDDSVAGTPPDPSLDEVLLAAITDEFDGSSRTRPVIGLFQELLKGDTPPATSTNGINLLAGTDAGAFVAFQACGGWSDGSLCTFDPADTTPENGFALGHGTYGARYYELYAGDLANPDFTAMLTTWRTFLADPSDATNPVGLVATATATSRRNVLTWNDTSTLESGFVVERTGDPLGSWDVIATPGPDTVRYVDTKALVGRPSWYRVHATSDAGDLVMSNADDVAAH
jgi:hypothetical protein